jgi:AsmA-like C-terminal region/Protein of unknown function
VKRLPGQAARHLGRTGHLLLTAAMASTVIAMTGAAVLAWRLSQGPIASAYLAHRIETVLNGDGPTQVHVGRAEIAWEGFRSGADRPLDIRLENITAVSPAGETVIDVPRVDVALSVGELLLGRLRPRRISVVDTTVRLERTRDGRVSLALDTAAMGTTTEAPDAGSTRPSDTRLGPMLRELEHPPQTDIAAPRLSRFAQLRRIQIRQARFIVDDRALGLTWELKLGQFDVTRRPEGGVEGAAAVDVVLGGQTVSIAARAMLDADAAHTHVIAKLGTIRPASLAPAASLLAPLASLDAPVTATADAVLGRALNVEAAHLLVEVGAGQVVADELPVALNHARLELSGGPKSVSLNELRLEVLGHPGATPSIVTASGTITDPLRHAQADITLGLDQVALADLGNLVPKDVGSNGLRPWVLQNITAGTARNGQFHLVLDIPPDFSDIGLPAATGSVDGQDITLHWLRPVPPVEHASGTLRILDPDTMDILFQSGRQRPSGPRADTAQGALTLTGGKMRITGMMHPHQLGKIDAEITGSIPQALALLREKRLHLLDKHPIDLRDPAGTATAKLGVTLPLEDSVTVDQIGIRAEARLESVHLTAIAAGHDLDRGNFDLVATNDGLTVKGQGVVAGFNAQLGVALNFLGGAPSEVVETVTATGRADAKQLAQVGISAGTIFAGTAGFRVNLTEKRDGTGALGINYDLRDADLTVRPLNWQKKVGDPAAGEMQLRLDHDKVTGADLITLDGDGLSVRAQADYSPGGIDLHLQRFVLANSDATGDAHFPPGGGEISATLRGRQLDLSPRFSEHTPSPKPPPSSQARGQPWSIDARFDRALMNHGQVVTGLTLRADNDGRLFRQVLLDGTTGARSAFRFEISPGPGGRALSARAADAGEVLRALDITDKMVGGTLSITGRYDDSRADLSLNGRADITDFRIRNAPLLGKLLEAMTLYGLYDIVRGPGLGFTRMEAPFTLSNDVLTLQSMRAVSPSLGLTAQGTIDIAANTTALQGTIVPAYVFNSLLGRMPVLGPLFSPEKGGGMFAAGYSVHGSLDSPDVSVNPLAALTPGILRNLFNIF